MEPWLEKSGESLESGESPQGSVLICLLRRVEWLGKSQGGVSSVSGVELSDCSKMGWRGGLGMLFERMYNGPRFASAATVM